MRWAVLIAWATRLRNRNIPVPQAIWNAIDEAQAKLSVGCFSPCEVGCLLNTVEGSLLSIEGSTPQAEVDYWTDLVGKAMSENIDTVELLKVPGVKVHYSSCFDGSCHCKGRE